MTVNKRMKVDLFSNILTLNDLESIVGHSPIMQYGPLDYVLQYIIRSDPIGQFNLTLRFTNFDRGRTLNFSENLDFS